MSALELTVCDMTDDLEIDVSVPLESGSSVDQLITLLVSFLKWPRLDCAGEAVHYVLLDHATRQIYPGGRTIGETGLMRAARVVLTLTPRGS